MIEIGHEDNKIISLLEETFIEPQVLDVALYIMSSQALGEAIQQGLMGNYREIKGVPPQLVDTVSKHDAALTNNKFFIENYAVIRAFTIFDKIKLSTIGRLAVLGEKENDKDATHALEHMMYSKMDALVIVAFLWKGYDFACDFLTKLRLLVELSPSLEQYFERNG